MGKSNRRLALFMGLAVVFLVALLGRTFYVQVIAAPALEQKVAGQSVRTITLEAPRGVIYDRNGQILAISRDTTSVYCEPKRIEDAAAAAAALSPILGLDEQALMERLTGASEFRYLIRRIDQSVGQRVKDMVKEEKLAGIGVMSEPKRVYPKGALAPQLLGFVGGDDYSGMAGLEHQYDELLSGEPGRSQVVSDLNGNRLSTVSLEEAVPGASLYLTIDAEIQYETERVLKDVVERFEAKKACAVVIDPHTGEILAMANTPVFDANEFASPLLAESDRRNMVVTDQYEPGSTFKMVVVAAALEEGLVTPNTVYKLGKTISVYDRVVHEAHPETTPAVREYTVTQILAKSSNVGAVTLGLEVGKAKLVETILRLGFTKKLGIDFPSEAAGQMLPPDKWSGTTIANVPMGHGIAVSPLQLAAAYAVIANGGMTVQPHLVRSEGRPSSKERVVSETVAAQLRQMLTVTVEDGTGKPAAVEGYQVAGKTGTAQKVKETGGYYDDRVVASFVGMVPAADPRLVILVTVDEPGTAQFGSSVAAPAFAKIADFALKRLGVAPASSD